MNNKSLADLSDEELVKLHVEMGAMDDRPFQELFGRYHNLVWRVCYSTLRNSQDAEDLAQEVFLKVHRYLGNFEGRASLKTWIYQIALNTSRNELRRRSRRPDVSDTDVDTMAEYLPSPLSVEAEWQQRRQREQIALALNQLKPDETTILHLKDYEERPYHEIAQTLAISLSAAKMRAKRARVSMRAAYTQVVSEEFAY
jgi:RNA polymerase sigma-70 factor (ECF subfamily)